MSLEDLVPHPLSVMRPPFAVTLASPLDPPTVVLPPPMDTLPPLVVSSPVEVTVSAGPPSRSNSFPSLATSTPSFRSTAGVLPNCSPGVMSLVSRGASPPAALNSSPGPKVSALAVLATNAPPTSILALGPKTIPLGLMR